MTAGILGFPAVCAIFAIEINRGAWACLPGAEIIPFEPDLFNYSVGNYVYII
jgi:hypothetical protein